MVYHRIERRPSILSCHSFDALFLTGHGIIMIISASSLGNLIHTWLTYDKTKKQSQRLYTTSIWNLAWMQLGVGLGLPRSCCH